MDSSGDAARYPVPLDLSTDEVEGVARAAGVVGGATLASRVLGLARDVVLANVFARGATDAFFIAFMIPNLFRRLVGEGALTGAFVPVFTGFVRRGEAEALSAFRAAWTVAAAAGLLAALLGIVFAEPLITLFAPGFASQPGKSELAVTLLRWCSPYIFFLTLVAVAMGALHALGHFFTPAIAPVLLNLCLIGAALGLATRIDPPILALGYAVIAAGALQLLLQIPALKRRGLSPAPSARARHPAVSQLLVLLGPAALGASVYQVNLLVVRFLSSFQGDGAVSYLYYADRLMELPLGIFVFALAMASLPSFSRLVKQGEVQRLRDAFAGTLTLTIALALPSTLGLVLLREPIFSALFSWNARLFDEAAVQGCAMALSFYALGLVPVAVSRICVQLFLAHEDTRTPARGAVLSMIVNLLFALALIPLLAAEDFPGAASPIGAAIAEAVVALQARIMLFELGYPGLALATTIAAAANAAYLCWRARRRIGRLLVAEDLRRLLRIALAAFVMALGVFAAEQGLGSLPSGKATSLALLAGEVALGVALYGGALALLRSPELTQLLRLVERR